MKRFLYDFLFVLNSLTYRQAMSHQRRNLKMEMESTQMENKQKQALKFFKYCESLKEYIF